MASAMARSLRPCLTAPGSCRFKRNVPRRPTSVLRWRKLGLVFSPQALPERPPWLAEFAQAPATLLFDDRVRVFFSCRPPVGPDGMYASRSAFVDLDRGDLTRVLCV